MPGVTPIAPPVWSPDGRRIAFGASIDSGWGLFIKPADGGKEQPVQQSAGVQSVSDWSPDSRWLVYTESNTQTGADIWARPDPSAAQASGKPVVLVSTPGIDSQGRISPDGQWIAYTSRELERHVYLRPFSVPMKAESMWQVSTVNGAQPQWRSDGKELFYLEAGARSRFKVMAVPIGSGANPAGSPHVLFEIPTSLIIDQNNVFGYAPSPDGQRFLIDVFATDAQPSLELVLNWAAPVGR
jgi:Tol biopolymer transport system component